MFFKEFVLPTEPTLNKPTVSILDFGAVANDKTNSATALTVQLNMYLTTEVDMYSYLQEHIFRPELNLKVTSTCTWKKAHKLIFLMSPTIIYLLFSRELKA